MSNPCVVLQKKGLITIENRSEPALEDPYFVKVHVKRTGICGSDVHYFCHGANGKKVVKNPMILGHESAGEVVEVGSAVTRVQVGDKVAIEAGIPSRYSDATKSGHYNLCPEMKFAASPPQDGTLRKYILSPEDFLHKLPENVSFEEGALCEPLAVGVHAAKLANVRFGDKVVVFGAGPVGLLAAAVVKNFGASEVCVVDIFDAKLELAKNFGATQTFNSREYKLDDEAAAEALVKQFGEADVVLECAGAEICVRTGLRIVRRGGQYVQIGMGGNNANIPLSEITFKELHVHGNFRYSFGDYRDAIALVAKGLINVKQLVSHRFTFDDAAKAYDFNANNGAEVMKTMILGVGEEL